MSTDEFHYFWLGCFLGVALMALVLLYALLFRDDHWRNEAVERGHAEYYLNAQHQREWRWLTNR